MVDYRVRGGVSKETQENVSILERMVNSFGFKCTEMAEYFARVAHRTLQQNLTRFCIEWLRVCASDDYGYDGRNEASHKVAKQLLEGKDGRDTYLPFI